MAVRPPKQYANTLPPDPVSAMLDHELRSEAASTHGRLLKKLERALARLEAANDGERADCVAEAGEALWYLTVQRDMMGFRNTQALLADLNVPADVRLSVGVRRRDATADPKTKKSV